ncbi:putative Acyltransferase [Seiridium cardinale]
MVNSGGAINDKDPFRELGTNPTESYKLADRRLSTFDLACYGLRNMVNFCRTPANRVVCIPASFVAELHKTALADVAGSVKAEAFLSEGDVITAWWTRIVTSQLDRKSHRTVAINNAYSLRKVLAADLLPNGTTYSSNAIGFIIVLLPIHDVLDRPLGHVASYLKSHHSLLGAEAPIANDSTSTLEKKKLLIPSGIVDIRAAIQDLGTRSQTEAFMSLWRTARGRLPPLFGDTGMYMLTFSNWNRARLFETDFSAAVVAGPDNEHSTESRQSVGRPAYLQNTQSGLKLPNAIPITGKDNHGNYWLSGYMSKELWGKVEKALAKL